MDTLAAWFRRWLGGSVVPAAAEAVEAPEAPAWDFSVAVFAPGWTRPCRCGGVVKLVSISPAPRWLASALATDELEYGCEGCGLVFEAAIVPGNERHRKYGLVAWSCGVATMHHRAWTVDGVPVVLEALYESACSRWTSVGLVA